MKIVVICGVMGKTWCQARHKSVLCVRKMSPWNRNDQKEEEKHFTSKPPTVPHFAGIFFTLQCIICSPAVWAETECHVSSVLNKLLSADLLGDNLASIIIKMFL